jgi:hypothetical protein
MESAQSELTAALEQALIRAVVTNAMRELVTLSSFFALPVIGPIVSSLLTVIVGFLVKKTALGLSLLWITLSVTYEVDSAERATAALKLMLNNPEEYSRDQQQTLEASFDDAAIALIRISASTVSG